VADRRRSSLNLDVLLSAVEAAPPIAAAEVVAAALGETLDAREVSFLIADFSGRSLVRLSHVARGKADGALGRERGETVPLEGTPHGRALAEQNVEVVAENGGSRLFAPVSSRGEAVGLLELGLDHPPDDQALATVAGAAHALAYIVIANRRFTDLFEWGQRTLPLSLEAEIQHRLLPGSYTCEAGQFTLAGWLEPAGDVGGDTFDFSLDRDTLHLSMTDAMGHTLDAALLATVLVGALRSARRRGAASPSRRSWLTMPWRGVSRWARRSLTPVAPTMIRSRRPSHGKSCGGSSRACPCCPSLSVTSWPRASTATDTQRSPLGSA
jgi:hypothetical protein